MRTILIAATAAAAVATASAAPEPWALMAERDLQGLHDALAENHPGAVDPENHAFKDWMESGLVRAKERAAGATSYSDYRRALRFYVNGFREAHTQLNFLMTLPSEWPGFIAQRTPDGAMQVAYASEDSPAPVGSEVVSCDGKPIAQVLSERIDPYFWNPELPQARGLSAWRLFYTVQGDSAQPRACVFRSSAGTAEKPLSWKVIDNDAYAKLRAEALSGGRPPMGVRQVDGVWFISIPSFGGDPKTDDQLKALVEEVTTRREALRAAPLLVVDVRGNGGGNSDWGDQIAAALWGKPWRDRVSESFDWTHDWRASKANIARMRAQLEYDKAHGHDPEYSARSLQAMEEAAAHGRAFARLEEKVTPISGPAPDNPVKGRVFFLTDNSCGSACLDFADLMRRLPGVTHVGLPTYADAVYMDLGGPAVLPSGIAEVRYSMKVYRRRVRANNEWYEPKVRWPGGPMSDKAVAQWVKTLS